jgi:putative ABC transport system ATP-binding protein
VTLIHSEPNKIVLEGRGISRVFGQAGLAVRALQPTNIVIRRGEVVVLMGPSGSGKTTLLSILGLVLQPTEGEVFVDGRSVAGATSDELALLRRDRIGFIFQQFNLIPSLSAADNASLPLLLAGVRRAERTSRAKQVLDSVGISDKWPVSPRQLSGGEQQRVSIARALINGTSVLLCDEPTASLDSATGRGILTTLQELAHKKDRAVVIVTHDERVLNIADRLLHVEDGHVYSDAARVQSPSAVFPLPYLEHIEEAL